MVRDVVGFGVVAFKPGITRLGLSFTPLLLPPDHTSSHSAIVKPPTCHYVAACAPLDQTGTNGSLYHYRLAPDRLGGENVSGSASAGSSG